MPKTLWYYERLILGQWSPRLDTVRPSGRMGSRQIQTRRLTSVEGPMSLEQATAVATAKAAYENKG